MARYSSERKESLLRKLLPPINMSVAALSRAEGISEQTLYNWRNQVKSRGIPVPGDKNIPDDWPAEAKLAVVIETAALSEMELSQYCRLKGLYVEQIRAWKQACIDGQHSIGERKQVEKAQAKADQKRIKELEREHNRKEKALAETAALLVLRKKVTAYWSGDSEEE